MWIKSPFPGPISGYNIFKPDQYTFIKFKIVIKGLIVVEKQKLEVEPFFAVSWTFFEFLWNQDLWY